MSRVVVYSTRVCPYCLLAKRLLDRKRVAYTEIRVDGNPSLREEMTRRSGRRTVPQIFVGEHHVGGFDDLAAAERNGALDTLLRDSAA
ncbi:MAG: glutaredoxin 3 [Gammaproteobacteria bacterium]|nr:glutaredoxin 3 [Gammaproteobacteria bacterium]